MVTENQTGFAESNSRFDLPKSDLLDHLRNQIRGVETAGRMDDGSRVSSGSAVIDRLLPVGGYQRGTLIQWLTGGGQSADYLSLLVARQACADGGALVVFDPQHQFYPPAAAAIGINLDNLILLRTERPAGNQKELHNDLLWSIDQALRCSAVAAVWGPMGHINERWFRRFQLSAESSGCLGLFVQPIRESRQPSWAEVQWLVGHVRWPCDPVVPTSRMSTLHPPSGRVERSEGREIAAIPKRLDQNSKKTDSTALPARSSRPSQREGEFRTSLVRLQLTRCRGTQTGKTINLSINTITGNVRLARRDHEQQQRENRSSRNQSSTADESSQRKTAG